MGYFDLPLANKHVILTLSWFGHVSCCYLLLPSHLCSRCCFPPVLLSCLIPPPNTCVTSAPLVPPCFHCLLTCTSSSCQLSLYIIACVRWSVLFPHTSHTSPVLLTFLPSYCGLVPACFCQLCCLIVGLFLFVCLFYDFGICSFVHQSSRFIVSTCQPVCLHSGRHHFTN